MHKDMIDPEQIIPVRRLATRFQPFTRPTPMLIQRIQSRSDSMMPPTPRTPPLPDFYRGDEMEETWEGDYEDVFELIANYETAQEDSDNNQNEEEEEEEETTVENVAKRAFSDFQQEVMQQGSIR